MNDAGEEQCDYGELLPPGQMSAKLVFLVHLNCHECKSQAIVILFQLNLTGEHTVSC